jgi:hypothetical protein
MSTTVSVKWSQQGHQIRSYVKSMSTRCVHVLVGCLANFLSYNFQLIRGPVKMCYGGKSGTQPKVLNFKTNETSDLDKLSYSLQTSIDNAKNPGIIVRVPAFQCDKAIQWKQNL